MMTGEMSKMTAKNPRRMGSLLLCKMAQNSQKPLISFEDLRPYVKLVGKSWWILLAFSLAGYGLGKLAAHRMVDIHKATAEILIQPQESSQALTAAWENHVDPVVELLQ